MSTQLQTELGHVHVSDHVLSVIAGSAEIRREGEATHVDLYIVVSYGTRISEVAHNVQSRVKYVLNEVTGLKVDYVNIIVQGVRVSQ